jgi:hypothetical protein
MKIMSKEEAKPPKVEETEKKVASVEVTDKPKRRWWCCVVPVVIIFLAIVAFIVSQLMPQDYSKHTPSKGYVLPQPSAEAQNRQLECNDFREYKLNPDKYRPLCLNLYKATADQINQANSGGQYDVVLLYGQYSTFRLYLPSKIRDVSNVGESFIEVAKFNDLITIPKMMDWYGLSNLDYIPKELSPYSALAYHFADQEKLKELCGGYAAGCAILNFQTVIKDVFLMPMKDTGMLAKKDNGDLLQYDIKQPSDCLAITTITHETGHTFLVANKISVRGMVTDGWLHAPTYFNENLTEIFSYLFADDICGPGTIAVEKMVIGGQPAKGGLIEFNGAFPPDNIHPTSFPNDNQCEQAIISSFSHYLLKGDNKVQFKNFVIAFRQGMKSAEYDAYRDDKKMARFMLKMLGNDPAEKEFLNSHACGI